MKPRIVVIGSSNTDMIIKLPHLPGPGETVLGGEFTVAHGGKGANQAVAAARAGGDVAFISCIGDDIFGQKALDNLKGNGIGTAHIKILKGVASGIALINVSQTGENSISVAPGANSHLTPSDIIDKSDVIRTADVILIQLEIPIETVAEAISLAGKFRVPVILNPAPACILPDDLMQNVDILTPNEYEAALLAGTSYDKMKYENVAQTLAASGPDTVIITLGENGAYYHNAGKGSAVSGYKVNVIDTTAAGDTFNGYLAVSMASGATIEAAVKTANRAAAMAVTRLGAQTSIPVPEEINAFFPGQE
jgi:ribokinase